MLSVESVRYGRSAIPSPFPGMDPFIESHDWEDFQTGFIAELCAALVPRVRPKYVVRKERRKYLSKRESILASTTHLVELVLLRGGERLPTVESLPPGDYYAFVCRQKRYQAEVYAWTLRNRLPAVPIPLAGKRPARERRSAGGVHFDLRPGGIRLFARLRRSDSAAARRTRRRVGARGGCPASGRLLRSGRALGFLCSTSLRKEARTRVRPLDTPPAPDGQ